MTNAKDFMCALVDLLCLFRCTELSNETVCASRRGGVYTCASIRKPDRGEGRDEKTTV